MLEWYTLWKMLILIMGAGYFLRIVAKDVRRRDKYLTLRLEKEMHEQKLKDTRQKLDEEAEGTKAEEAEEAEEETEVVATSPPEDAREAA